MFQPNPYHLLQDYLFTQIGCEILPYNLLLAAFFQAQTSQFKQKYSSPTLAIGTVPHQNMLFKALVPAQPYQVVQIYFHQNLSSFQHYHPSNLLPKLAVKSILHSKSEFLQQQSLLLTANYVLDFLAPLELLA